LTAAILGLAWTLWRRREKTELMFWLLMAGAPIVVAPLMIFDDGWRALTSIGPLVALLLASGFATPAGQQQGVTDRGPVGPYRAFALGLVVLVLLASAPGVAHRLDLVGLRTLNTVSVDPDEVWILGGRAMAGLLVVPDIARLPRDVPALHYSDFERIVRHSGVEQYGPVLYPELRSRAFAFVATLGSIWGPIFIAPPEVMRNQDARGWKLRVANRGGGFYFWLCDRAEAVP
jgi:hypothetical protein